MVNELLILTTSILWSFFALWGLKVLFINFNQNISKSNLILLWANLTLIFYFIYNIIQGMIFDFILIKPGYISVNSGSSGGYFWEGNPGCNDCFEKHNLYKTIFKYFWVFGGLFILVISILKFQWKSFIQQNIIRKSRLNIVLSIFLLFLLLFLGLISLVGISLGAPGWETYEKEMIYIY